MKKREVHRLEVRLNPDLFNLLDEEAQREHRSLNRHIEYILDKHVEEVQKIRAAQRRQAAFEVVREAGNG
jgi:hypothetical protein